MIYLDKWFIYLVIDKIEECGKFNYNNLKFKFFEKIKQAFTN